MIRKATALAALALVGSSFAITDSAEARRGCPYVSKTTGAVIGGVGGAVLGGVLTHGSTGPIVGAAGGALAGHSIAKHNRRKCGYYRSYRRR